MAFLRKKSPFGYQFILVSVHGSQLFTYALHTYIREGKNYDKVYILNPRFELLEELVLNRRDEVSFFKY